MARSEDTDEHDIDGPEEGMQPGLRSIIDGYGGRRRSEPLERRRVGERKPHYLDGPSNVSDVWRRASRQARGSEHWGGENRESPPRSRRTWGTLLVLGVAVTVALVVVLTRGSTAPVRKRPVAVVPSGKALPLTIRYNVYGARPFIRVRVGNGPTVPVLLDTGSIGLHIYAPGVKLGPRSGVALSTRSDSAEYFDGTVQRGVIGRAKLTIDGVKTTTSVPFGLITDIGCAHQIPCPAEGGIGASVARGDYGILGIGLRRDPGGLTNPLLALSRADGRTWSIVLHQSTGSLIIGAPDPSSPLAHFKLAPDGHQPNGARAWKDDHARVCWAAVGLRGAGCEPTVFDTGSQITFWYGGLMSHATTYPGSILVDPGTFIAAWQPGESKPFWAFTAGTDTSSNTVFALNIGHPGVIAAVQTFLRFEITYDAARGEIFVSSKP